MRLIRIAAPVNGALERNFSHATDFCRDLQTADSFGIRFALRPLANLVGTCTFSSSLMVTENARLGLIVTAGRRTSALLDDLIAYYNWPVLFQPSVRLLFQQIEVCQPRCLLFWLEGQHEIVPTTRLIARLRDRGPRPYRVAIAHQMGADVEPTFRAAGVHTYLSASSDIAALVSGALNALLNGEIAAAHAHHLPDLIPEFGRTFSGHGARLAGCPASAVRTRQIESPNESLPQITDLIQHTNTRSPLMIAWTTDDARHQDNFDDSCEPDRFERFTYRDRGNFPARSNTAKTRAIKRSRATPAAAAKGAIVSRRQSARARQAVGLRGLAGDLGAFTKRRPIHWLTGDATMQISRIFLLPSRRRCLPTRLFTSV